MHTARGAVCTGFYAGPVIRLRYWKHGGIPAGFDPWQVVRRKHYSPDLSACLLTRGP